MYFTLYTLCKFIRLISQGSFIIRTAKIFIVYAKQILFLNHPWYHRWNWTLRENLWSRLRSRRAKRIL